MAVLSVSSKHRSVFIAAITILAFLLVAPNRHAYAMVVSLTFDETLRMADQVIVGTVLAAKPRVNERDTFIMTDYHIKVEQSLYGDARVGDTAVITQAGGTIGEVTTSVSIAPTLGVGERYLLITNSASVLCPFVGAGQGVYRETARASASGKPGVYSHGAGSDSKAPAKTFAELTEYARLRLGSLDADELLGKTPARFLNTGRRWTRRLDYTPTGNSLTAFIQKNTPSGKTDGPHNPNSVVFAKIAPPALLEILPGQPLEYAIPDQIAKWNSWALIFVSKTPDGYSGWLDGQFDIVGFISDEDIARIYGLSFPEFENGWAGFSGVTFSLSLGSVIMEADILINPNLRWTTDRSQLSKTSYGAPAYFPNTMLHELGHAFGLLHPWEYQNVTWPSIMNYESPFFSMYDNVFADDALAIRTSFPTQAHSGTDLGFYLWDTLDAPPDETGDHTQYVWGEFHDPVFANSVIGHAPDGKFNFHPMRMENVGSETIVNPVINFYLSKFESLDTGPAYLIKTHVSDFTLQEGESVYYEGFLFDDAVAVPPGRYYLASKIVSPGSGDRDPRNNVDFSAYRIRVGPSLQFDSSSSLVSETGGMHEVRVSVSNGLSPTTQNIQADYAITGTATNGDDYVLDAGTLLVLAGERLATLQIPILNDELDEGPETIAITLSAPVNAFLGDAFLHVVTIVDDDKVYPPADFAKLDSAIEILPYSALSAPLYTDGSGNWLSRNGPMLFSSDNGVHWSRTNPRDYGSANIADNGSGKWGRLEWDGFEFSTNAGLIWSDPLDIYNGDTYASARRDLATDGKDTWIAVWNSLVKPDEGLGRDNDILFTVSSDDGGAWPASSPLNSDAWEDDSGSRDTAPRIETDGNGKWVAVWQKHEGSAQEYCIRFAYSDNDGVSWSQARDLTARSSIQGNQADQSLIPQLALGKDGRFLVLFDTASGDLVLHHSSDGGKTWSAGVTVSQGTVVEHVYGGFDMATDQKGKWAVVWDGRWAVGVADTDPVDRDVFISRSSDNGLTWSEPAPINSNSGRLIELSWPNTGFVFTTERYPHLATDKNGKWILNYNSNDPIEGNDLVFYGRTFYQHSIDPIETRANNWMHHE